MEKFLSASLNRSNVHKIRHPYKLENVGVLNVKRPIYKMREKVWLHSGMTSWHFVNVNKKVSREIKQLFGGSGRGFGSIPVTVVVGKTSWKTSIFPDKKTGTYLMPLKVQMRKKEGILVGKIFNYSIEIRI